MPDDPDLPVIVTIGGDSHRRTIAPMGGLHLTPFAKDHRERTGITPGQALDVALGLDTAPRTVEVPVDLAVALASEAGARQAFDGLASSIRTEHVRPVGTAKAAATRERRIHRIVAGS